MWATTSHSFNMSIFILFFLLYQWPEKLYGISPSGNYQMSMWHKVLEISLILSVHFVTLSEASLTWACSSHHWLNIASLYPNILTLRSMYLKQSQENTEQTRKVLTIQNMYPQFLQSPPCFNYHQRTLI